MIYLLGVSLIWAFSFGLIKMHLTGLDSSLVACTRLLIAVPIFVPWLRIRSLSRVLIVQALVIGAIQYGLMYLLVIRAYQYLPAYQVALMTTMTPLYVILFSQIAQRRMRWILFLPALLAIIGAAGIYYKGLQDLSIWTKGCLLVQGSDICFALGQVAYQRLAIAKGTEMHSYALFLVGGVLVTAGMTSFGGSWNALMDVSLNQWYTLLYLGAIASGLGFLGWMKGSREVSAGVLAVFNNLKIPLGVAVSLIVFGEQCNFGRLAWALGWMSLAIMWARRLTTKGA